MCTKYYMFIMVYKHIYMYKYMDMISALMELMLIYFGLFFVSN